MTWSWTDFAAFSVTDLARKKSSDSDGTNRASPPEKRRIRATSFCPPSEISRQFTPAPRAGRARAKPGITLAPGTSSESAPLTSTCWRFAQRSSAPMTVGRSCLAGSSSNARCGWQRGGNTTPWNDDKSFRRAGSIWADVAGPFATRRKRSQIPSHARNENEGVGCLSPSPSGGACRQVVS